MIPTSLTEGQINSLIKSSQTFTLTPLAHVEGVWLEICHHNFGFTNRGSYYKTNLVDSFAQEAHSLELKQIKSFTNRSDTIPMTDPI